VGPTAFLDLKGRFVFGEEDVVKVAVNSLLEQGRRQFVLNLREVTFMDTTGLSAMISIRLAIQKRGCEIKLVELPRRIYDLLIVTKLTTLFDIVTSENEAVASFSMMA